MRTHFIVAAALAVVFGCKGDSGDVAVDLATTENTATMSRQEAIEQARTSGILGSADLSSGFDVTDVYGPIGGRKQIKTGEVRLVVAAYDDARTKLDALVGAAQGTIESTNVSRGRDAVSEATIVLRIPPAGIGEFVAKLRQLGEVTSEATTTTDITNDYDDTAAKLAAARVLEKRLLQLAASPNGKIEDVLAVEHELASVRGEIEGFETKIRHWDGEVAMSAMTVQITTKRPEIPAPPPPAARTLGDRIGDDFHASIDSMRSTGEWLASRSIALLPWLVIALPFLLLLRRLARRVRLPWAIIRKRKPEPEPAPPTE